MTQTIGFVGLGIMGRPMARNLLKAGYPLVVHSRSQGPVQELVGAGAKAASAPRDVAGQVEVLITMLPNSPDVELVALGSGGIVEGARSGLLFADMSTISPIVSKKVGAELAKKGQRLPLLGDDDVTADRNYIKEFVMRRSRELGQQYGVEYAEAFHYIETGAAGADRDPRVEAYVKEHAVPMIPR